MRATTFHAIAAILIFAFAAASVPAAELDEFAGTWAMRLSDRNFFVIRLTVSGGAIAGVFDHPAKFSSTNSIFANIRGGVLHDKIIKSRLENNALHFTVQDADAPSDQDQYTMTVEADRAYLAFDGLPATIALDPWVLNRVSFAAQVATDWPPNRAYVAGDSDVPSAEMKAIYDEDQRARMQPNPDWPAVTRTDAERREQTHKLLAAGALHTGKDYEEASFVFQHGNSPQDFLLAHTLAMVAVSKGDSTAIWIAAATLDRYLQKIGQPQIYGTQFQHSEKSGWTQDPYDRSLVSDALRRQLGVPSQSTQIRQLDAYSKQN